MTDPLADPQRDDILLESLPDEIVASMERRDEWMASLPYAEGGLEYLVADLQSWAPGQTVRVAFLGGSPELHADIEAATRQISDASNLTLDFKEDGAYRTWSTSDTEYAAEIRVSFDQRGYFSLVGTDSADGNIGLPGAPVGGGPGQRSLNLGGYDVNRPPRWEGTVRHEFLHALAFHHEHQNMRGPCEVAFRWDDDPGYVPTKDDRGTYVTDSENRRPGIYTFLSGAPNGWSRAKIDHNLRTSRDDHGLRAGNFDPASVMLYRFPPLFYKTQPSPCSPTGDGQALSDGDKQALELLYPGRADELATIGERREALLATIEGGGAEGGLESAGGPMGDLASGAAARLRASLDVLR